MSEVHIDMSDFYNFTNQIQRMRENLDKEFQLFLEGLGMDLLRIVQEEIIRREVVDTRLLLQSFEKNGDGNVWAREEANLRVEVGSALEYSRYVNDGHWLNPKGVEQRFVPGYWDGDTFVYVKGAKTGMVLKQKWIEGQPYWDSALRILEGMLPELMQNQVNAWFEKYFGTA